MMNSKNVNNIPDAISPHGSETSYVEVQPDSDIPTTNTVLNIGNRNIYVTSILNNYLDNNGYDNYDTLDTFEACRLNIDFSKLSLDDNARKPPISTASEDTLNVNSQSTSLFKFFKRKTSLPNVENDALHILDHNVPDTQSKIDLHSADTSFVRVNYDDTQTNSELCRGLLKPEANPIHVNFDDNRPHILSDSFTSVKQIDNVDKGANEQSTEKISNILGDLISANFGNELKQVYKSSHKDKATPLVFRRVRKRLINKDGSTNVAQSNISRLKIHYLTDIFTTLLDTRWRWSFLIFTLGFLLSWLFFAIIWWFIAFTHGDLEHTQDPEWHPCYTRAYGFISAFLFSIELQHTIGFGYRHITEECPEAILVFIIQAITGTMIQGFVIGLIFSKLSRPKKRACTLMFSKNAVVCTRDGKLCLLVRIGDMRKSHIIDARTRAYLFRKKVTLEGEIIPLHPHIMNLSFDPKGFNDRIFLGWPSILIHEISEKSDSPLYNLGARDLMDEKFEIVVILEGMIEASGMSMQARTSYLPSEILWGHRFQKLITYVREDGEYNIDYSRFHDTQLYNMPLCSARDLDILRKKYMEKRKKLLLKQRLRSTPVSPEETAAIFQPDENVVSFAKVSPKCFVETMNESKENDVAVSNHRRKKKSALIGLLPRQAFSLDDESNNVSPDRSSQNDSVKIDVLLHHVMKLSTQIDRLHKLCDPLFRKSQTERGNNITLNNTTHGVVNSTQSMHTNQNGNQNHTNTWAQINSQFKNSPI